MALGYDGVIEMTQSSRNGEDIKLLCEAIAALRELLSRTQDATDESFDDGHSVDIWKSEELRAATDRAEAVIAKAEAAMAASRTE
ncbi:MULTISPECIES: hypothetical protein [Bradyrhizobium]|jgi:hypothetical protein|uniref:Uncharacterized protein n=2 Tax=Bradyrhizobium elkanii TaxID=29448 RepID=A0A7Y8UJ33_BRAEL|nr:MULTISPECIES: hypothetical protein [Bradyrhizobium]MBP1299509.1 hypothetical protein [Bradyrhizobium elkanii]MCP1755952.1 hypothetical protein [Bradyrhizobium elkanii]MCP1929627.1 hypothetical protein [Bradyrhizobium elkanii]MCP1971815.1 hypothetical protein [Bradyrhizobium elkanii]MCP1981467.1 hypothetical protein [Bradyrhizobium elkanii]